MTHMRKRVRSQAAEKKRMQEYRTVLLMIQLYCKYKHGRKTALRSAKELCSECSALAAYVREREAHCPFMEAKTFCSLCKVHCYRNDMREKIKNVMRYSGPRMLLYCPITAIRHLVLTVKAKHTLHRRLLAQVQR